MCYRTCTGSCLKVTELFIQSAVFVHCCNTFLGPRLDHGPPVDDPWAKESKCRHCEIETRSGLRGCLYSLWSGGLSLVCLKFLSSFYFHGTIDDSVRGQWLQPLYLNDHNLQSNQKWKVTPCTVYTYVGRFTEIFKGQLFKNKQYKWEKKLIVRTSWPLDQWFSTFFQPWTSSIFQLIHGDPLYIIWVVYISSLHYTFS